MSRLKALCPYTAKQLVDAAISIDPTLANADYVTLPVYLTAKREEREAEYKIAENEGDYTLSVAKKSGSNTIILHNLLLRMAVTARLSVANNILLSSADEAPIQITERVVRGKRRVRLETMGVAEMLPNDISSHHCEQVAKAILKCSTTPKLDCIRFFETLYFCWLIGDTTFNVDRLRIVTTQDGFKTIAPITHLTSTPLLGTNGRDECSILVNDKRREITSDDFIESMLRCGIERKVAVNVIGKFAKYVDAWCDMIEASQISEELAEQFKFMLFLKI